MLMIQSRNQIVQIKEILKEDDKRFEHLIELLEKWMDCHDFLPKYYDKQMLPIFLRNCRYNLDKTKRKLELYFVNKKRYPEVFCFHEFNDREKRSLDNFYIFESSKLTPKGYRVAFGGFRSPDTTGCDMNVVNKILSMYGTYKANRDVVNCGVIIVLDLQNLSPSIVSGIVSPFFKRLLDMLQKFAPFHIGGAYITFLPGFVVPIANMIKLMFKEKLVRRAHIETENKQMIKDIPACCLPEEFGGTDGTINENTIKFIQELIQAKTWFQEHEKMQWVGNIPKTLYEASGIDENFGTRGSFRQLNID